MVAREMRTAIAAAAAAASLVSAQEPAFRSASDLVVVPTTVTDRAGRFVRGLTQADFEILEDDGDRRPIAQFSANRAPVSVAIVLDISGSMSTEPNRWDLTRRALASFLSRLEGNDEVTLIAFNDRHERLGGWTRHTFDVFSALGRVQVGGGTALYRALLNAVPVFKDAAHARRALLLISDGNDHEPRSSGFTPGLASSIRASDAIRRSGVTVYAIGIGMGAEPVNRRALGHFSEPTGGYFEVVSDGSTLESAIGRVADDLRDQYILAFEPSKSDGEFHRIRVRTRADGHRVRARAGYVAASSGR